MPRRFGGLQPDGYRTTPVFALLAVACVFLYTARLSLNLDHTHYVWGDAGSCLQSSRILGEGKIPWIDFNYNYGGLSLLVGKFLFGLIGYTAPSYVVVNLLFSLLFSWGLARLIVIVNPTTSLLVLVLAGFPLMCGTVSHHIAHTAESSLLTHALANWVCRRHRSALFLATLSLTFKPSLAFFVGFFLLLDLLRECRRKPFGETCRQLVKTILPALIYLALYSLIVATLWGPRALALSLLPLYAAETYSAYNYGFFNAGKEFWLPQKASPLLYARYYFFSPAGVWVLGTLYLLHRLPAALAAWWADGGSLPQRVILFCGLLHLGFVAFLFAGPWSWQYYPALVLIGVVAGLATSRGQSKIRTALLLTLVTASLASSVASTLNYWKGRARPDFQYLFMRDEVYQNYLRIQQLAHRRRVVFLQASGAASLFFEKVDSPHVWMMLRGALLPGEVHESKRLLESAEVVVLRPPGDDNLDFLSWPETEPLLRRFSARYRGTNLHYLSRPEFKDEVERTLGLTAP